MTEQTTVHLQRCLDRLRAGDETARNELLTVACSRLSQLTRVMLKDYQRLKRWEETGDVLQNAMIRLYRALETVSPASLRDFYRLATLQIRRELIDLIRHYYGPAGHARNQATNAAEASSSSQPPLYEQANVTYESSRLAAWGEFHQQVQALPEEEREVFDLIYYQGMTHVEAAALLDVSARTVRRRWQAACFTLHEALGGELPGQ
jgi:RNA polymerase sigma-70 factor (ECF subfamily)